MLNTPASHASIGPHGSAAANLRVAAQERAFLRAQWGSSWVAHERVFAWFRPLLLPMAVALVAAFFGWVFYFAEDRALAGGVFAVVIAAVLWSCIVTFRRWSARRSTWQLVAHAAKTLGGQAFRNDLDALLRWLEEHWHGATPAAFYGPSGVLTECVFATGWDEGQPVLLAAWSQKCWQTTIERGNNLGEDTREDRMFAQGLVGNGVLVLRASPSDAPENQAPSAIGGFALRSTRAGVEAQLTKTGIHVPGWEVIQEVLETARRL